MAKKLFKEELKNQEKDLLVMVGAVALILLVHGISQLITAQTGHHPILAGILSIVVAAGLGVWLWYFSRKKSKTKLTEKRIISKVNALQSKSLQIPLNDIDSCILVETPLAAHWHGSNISFDQEEVVSVNGRNGLSIQTKDGKRYFIGSARPVELAEAVRKAIGTESDNG
ncbi:MAG: hypothetical protein R2795_25030 [Saprospiraceae bacterium]